MDTAERGNDTEFRLILVGKSGGGKSATGNNILGRKLFKSILTAKSTTLTCQRGLGVWQGIKITVVDTPALFEADDYNESKRREIMSCIDLSRPGPHALILVTQVGRFTAEDAAAAKCVQDIFGPESTRHMIVLFTCVEDLGGDSLQEYVQKSDNRNLCKLSRQCENRFCGFNNKATGAERERQVSELMGMVQRTVSQNGGRYYINQLYLEPNLQDEHVKMFIKQNQKRYRSWYNKFFVCIFCFLAFCCAFCRRPFSCLRNVAVKVYQYRIRSNKLFVCIFCFLAFCWDFCRRPFSCLRNVAVRAYRYFFS